MATRLYGGHLCNALESSDLEEVFRQVGEVVLPKVMPDMETGRSEGFSFVEMASDAIVTQAIEQLNGNEVGGRPLKVTEAIPVLKDLWVVTASEVTASEVTVRVVFVATEAQIGPTMTNLVKLPKLGSS